MKIKAYTLSTCIFCRALKKFLDENDVEYEYVDVDLLEGEEREKAIEEVIKASKTLKFPTLIIDGNVILGYNEDRIREVLRI